MSAYYAALSFGVGDLHLLEDALALYADLGQETDPEIADRARRIAAMIREAREQVEREAAALEARYQATKHHWDYRPVSY